MRAQGQGPALRPNTIKRGYTKLEKQLSTLDLSDSMTKAAQVEAVIDALPETFSKAELARCVPDISSVTIRNVLRQLKATGKLKLKGRRRGAKWTKIRSADSEGTS